jgi:hypothetical protein
MSDPWLRAGAAARYETLLDRADVVPDYSVAPGQQAVDLDSYLSWEAQEGGQAGVGGAKGRGVGDAVDGVREGRSAAGW